MDTYFQEQIEKLDSDISTENLDSIKAFFNDEGYAPMSESLAKATIEQLGGLQEFLESAADIANHGGNTGWSGFTYSADIKKFFQDNKADIIALGKSEAPELGYKSFIEMVGKFGCLKSCQLEADDIASVIYGDDDENDNYTQIVDSLGWYCLEHLARAYDNFTFVNQ